jgi:hypothetical protein
LRTVSALVREVSQLGVRGCLNHHKKKADASTAHAQGQLLQRIPCYRKRFGKAVTGSQFPTVRNRDSKPSRE